MNSNAQRWLYAAGIRALKTFAQAALVVIGLGEPITGLLEVSWAGVFSIAALAAVVSLLTSVAGLPELNLDNSGQNRTNLPPRM